jgi:hypothetical protein
VAHRTDETGHVPRSARGQPHRPPQYRSAAGAQPAPRDADLSARPTHPHSCTLIDPDEARQREPDFRELAIVELTSFWRRLLRPARAREVRTDPVVVKLAISIDPLRLQQHFVPVERLGGSPEAKRVVALYPDDPVGDTLKPREDAVQNVGTLVAKPLVPPRIHESHRGPVGKRQAVWIRGRPKSKRPRSKGRNPEARRDQQQIVEGEIGTEAQQRTIQRLMTRRRDQ